MKLLKLIFMSNVLIICSLALKKGLVIYHPHAIGQEPISQVQLGQGLGLQG